jgi:hypothetical protein
MMTLMDTQRNVVVVVAAAAAAVVVVVRSQLNIGVQCDR